MSQDLEFLEKISAHIADKSLVRLTLSKPRVVNSNLQKVLIKPVLIKKKVMLSFVFRFTTKDITKNYSIEESLQQIKENIEEVFLVSTLFTSQRDWILNTNKKGQLSLRSTKPTFKENPTFEHNKKKNHNIQAASFLTELNVTDAKGRINKDMGDKFKQINKFVEIIATLLKKEGSLLEQKEITVTDMGSGKGYLTFATYDYLVNKLGLNAEVNGIEIRPNLIKLCNNVAKKVGFKKLFFKEGFINNFALTKTDILIALHACDTATDDAILKGIEANAKLIICAPCCHKQIRKQIGKSAHLGSILKYGILKERIAETITDTIRALLLEANGYKTNVFEFISTEHTGKNVMVVGTKHDNPVNVDYFYSEIEKIKLEFGIEEHYLEKHLKVNS